MSYERVPFRIKLWYGAGQAGNSVSGFGFSVLLFLYYNQVLGLSGTYTGIGMAIALVFDAISDPVVGSWSDGFRSRWGRRHPFMILGAVPMAVLFFGIFWPPAGLSKFSLFLWFTIMSVLMRTAHTLFQVPYMSLGVELTQNYQERTKIAQYRYLIGPITSLITIAVAWNFFFVSSAANQNPQLTREPYFAYALLSAVMMAILLVGAAVGTRESIPHLAGTSQKRRKFNFVKVYHDLFDSLRSPHFRALFISTFVAIVYLGAQGSMLLHLQTFFWQLDSKGIQWLQYTAMIGAIVGIPLIAPMHRWIDKKWTQISCRFATMVCSILPVILALVGFMPTSLGILVPVLIVFALISAIGSVGTNVTTMSIVGDIADEHELRTGVRMEGVFFGSLNFIEKCFYAVGNMLAGFSIDYIGLDPNSQPGQVPLETLDRFGWVFSAFALISIIAFAAFLPYNISRKRHAEVLENLKQRKSADAITNP